LSMRVVDQETGEELEDTRPPRESKPRGDRGDRRSPRNDRGSGRGRSGDRGGRGRHEGGKDGGGEAHVPDFLKD